MSDVDEALAEFSPEIRAKALEALAWKQAQPGGLTGSAAGYAYVVARNQAKESSSSALTRADFKPPEHSDYEAKVAAAALECPNKDNHVQMARPGIVWEGPVTLGCCPDCRGPIKASR